MTGFGTIDGPASQETPERGIPVLKHLSDNCMEVRPPSPAESSDDPIGVGAPLHMIRAEGAFPARRSFFVGVAVLGVGAALTSLSFARAADSSSAQAGAAPIEVGSSKARVVIVEDPGAVNAFVPRLDVVRQMFDRGLTNWTGKASVAESWRAVVSTQDMVGIKVVSAPGPLSGTRPAVVEAAVGSMIEAGFPAKQIVIWDKHYSNLKTAGFVELAGKYGVRVAGSADAGYDSEHFYDSVVVGRLVWGDHEFGGQRPGIGRKSFVSKLLTREITKLISIAPLLNHNHAGVSGHLFSLAFGSVDNTIRFINAPGQLQMAVPDICALPEVGDKLVLNITDALVAQYYGEERALLHYARPLSQLRFSKDPVALDVLSIHEIERQRALADTPSSKIDLQLYANASLIELGVSELRDIQVEIIK
ncbi:MAG: DUF362 domain-containing protein [Verrucomicrobiota bacterium]|nr:DUF362 domain-containing protein [Verrucomicrobiota bacterium]